MKKIIKNICIVFLIIVVLSSSFIMVKLNSGKLIEPVESLIDKQTRLSDAITTEGHSIDNPNIIVNPYGNSPLTALICFETEEALEVTVNVVGKDEHTSFTHRYDAQTEHIVPVLGLYADSVNEVVLEVGDESYSFEIETEALPDDFIYPEYVKSNKEFLSNDLYFVTPATSGYTCAYDVNGDVRWYLTNTAIWKINRLENGHLLLSTERIVDMPYYNTGLYEMDMLGKIICEYTIPGGYHHDYYELENGNLLIATNVFETRTVEDMVVEMDRTTGEIIRTYDLRNVLNVGDGKSENWTSEDWFHNNSVWYDKATNSIVLSGRHQDAVISIDYDSGELNWILGDSTNWQDNMQPYFFTPIGEDFEWQWSQHAAMVTPEGYIFVLDNGNNKSKIAEEYVPASESYTRGVMYKIDTDNMTIEQIWQYGKERGSEFYSPYISDVDYINENHYLVHSGGISYVDGEPSNLVAPFTGTDDVVSTTVEILNDEVIYEISLPTNNYRAEKMSLYSDEEISLDKAVRLGSFNETKVVENEFNLHLFEKNVDEELLSRNVELNQESDRLVIKGEFKKSDEVAMILSQNGSSNRYVLGVNQHNTNTAMCVSIFSEEEKDELVNLTNYINKTGLNGSYRLFIELNGVVYDLGQKIKF